MTNVKQKLCFQLQHQINREIVLEELKHKMNDFIPSDGRIIKIVVEFSTPSKDK